MFSSFPRLFRMVLHQPGFLSLLASNVALGMAYSFVVPFMSMWGTHYVQMSPIMFGTFMTLTSISAIVMSLFLARWSDTHIPRRTMLICGSCGGMVGYLGYAFVRDPIFLILIGCLPMAVAAVNFSQVYAHVREELDRPEFSHVDAPFLISILRVSFSLAWTVGPAIGSWVMLKYSYRGIFLGAAALFGIFLLGILISVPSRQHPPGAQTAKNQPVSAILTRYDLIAMFAAFVLVFSAHSINLMNMPLMVTEQLGGTARNIGIIFSIAPFVEIPLMIWSGRLAARGHMMALLRIGAIATVLYFASLTLIHTPAHIYPIQLLSAVSIAILTNVTIPFFQGLLPGQPGLATTIYSNSFNAGNLLGYFAFGLFVAQLGHRGMFVFCAALSFATLTILCLYRPPIAQPANS